MKKPKLSLGPGGLKGLLIQHIEKIVFGVALLLVLVFVFLGYSLQSKLEGKTPDKLQALATTAVANIQRPTADEVWKERMPRDGKGGQYFARVQGIAPLDPVIYSIKPFSPPQAKPGSKREDPEIFPPIKLETAALTGAMCVRAEGGEERALAKLENAPALEKKEKTPKDRKKRGGRDSGGPMGSGGLPYGSGGGSGYPSGSGDDEDFGGMGSGGPMGPGSAYGDDRKKKKDDQQRGPERMYPESEVCGYRPSRSGLGMPGSPYGSGGMPGMSGPSIGGLGGPGTGGPSSGGLGMPSMGGSGGMGGSVGGEESSVAVAGQPIAASGSVIIVKALVPYRKQADEYKRVLGEALGFDPMRDQPRIVFFQAERVDVTDDPQKEVQEADWQRIMTPKMAQTKAKAQRWHGIMPEVADYMYVDTNATMPVPPMMLRCMDEAMLHSDVPRTKSMMTMETVVDDEGAQTDDSAQDDGGSDLPGGLPGGGVAGGGFLGGGMPGAGSMMPGAGSMMPGAGSMMPGAGSMMPGAGSMMPGAGSMMPGAGSMMPGAGSMMPGSGMGGYMGSYTASTEAVQYKLVRFCDTDAEPGKVYRYRVRVYLEDPNNPNTDPLNGVVNVPPRRRSLSLAVIDRLNRQQADEATKKSYYVVSPWSEATAPVSLPSTSRVFTGEVEPARMALGIDGTMVQQTEPYGNVVPVIWDDGLAIDVSTETRGYRGSVLNFARKQFDVLDPVTLVIKLLKGYDFVNQHMVLDVRGGEDLPGDRKKLVTSIGEYALMDDAGNIRVVNELDDYKEYARYSFADEIALHSPQGGYGSGGMMPGSGMPGTGMPGAGMPGIGMPGAGMPGTGMPGRNMPGTGGAPGSGGKRPRR